MTAIKRMWGSSPTEALKVLYTRIEAIRTALLGNRLLSNAGLVIGTTATNVASIAFTYLIGALAAQVNTFKDKAAVAAGTALAAGTIPINKWGVYLFSIPAGGAIASTAGSANFTTGYDTEAAAIAALPAAPAASAVLGYVTVLTAVGFTFIGGTSALAGGVGGNPASVTTYANAGPNFSGGVDLLLDSLVELR